jgi:tetratricopeptide (TPR) repeat protein
MDNYTEETQPLFKLLRTPAFKFIVVRFNHYSLVRRLQSDLRELFPDRKVSTINTEKSTYEEILKAFLEQEEGFFFLENFEDILKRDADSQGKVSPEMSKNNQRRSSIAAGLNMRRDKLAKSPIAIIAFVFASAGELYARSLMEKMPDLWSFRSLLLDLKLKQEATSPKILQMEPQWEPTTVSTLGGTTREEKLNELNRLLNEVKTIPATETNYLKTLYNQIAELQKETGQYEEAIKTIDYLIENSTDLEENFWLLIEKGDLFSTTGILEDALNVFNIAKEITDTLENDFMKGIVLQRTGNIYCDSGNLNNTLILQEKAMLIFQKLYESYPADKDLKNALAISYTKLGETHIDLGNIDKALQYFKDEAILFKELYIDYPQIVDFKKWMSISYQNLGITHSSLGNLDEALKYLENFNRLTKELNKAYPLNEDFKNGLAISYEKLGQTHTILGNLDKALNFFEERTRLGKELYEAYPQNVDFINGLAISYYKLGDFYKEKRSDAQTAKTYFLQARQLWEELVTTSPNHAEYRKNLEQVKKDLASLSD